jgi:hypothetical protein
MANIAADHEWLMKKTSLLPGVTWCRSSSYRYWHRPVKTDVSSPTDPRLPPRPVNDLRIRKAGWRLSRLIRENSLEPCPPNGIKLSFVSACTHFLVTLALLAHTVPTSERAAPSRWPTARVSPAW